MRRRPRSPIRSARRTSAVVLALGLSAGTVLGLGAAWFRPMTATMRMRNDVVVDAWRVGGGPLEPLASQDSVRVGDMVQLSVTSTRPTRLGAWSRNGDGEVRSWFGPAGAVVQPGEQVVVDRTGPFDARPGTSWIAVRVCPEDHSVGDDPWHQEGLNPGCRPYLWTLKKQ
ncbi:MAG: hypothetical protein CL927_16795 [Deltaproteobacteria bacterium]|nr:hypothetical protein [Deltaproteobacteria bacterium]HCH66853.1 hypothetical protein [Deltaproteobacteria bacterium]